MALDNFRRVDLRLNKANDYIPDNFFAKEGDYNGRELVAQVTNGPVVVNTQGIQLIFNWKHLNKGHSGAVYFDEEDISKGLYSVYYPAQMMFAGKVSCFITVVDGKKITNTRNFNVTVEAGADGNLIVAENDFSILQQALVQINQYQLQIDNIKADLIRQVNNLINTEGARLDQLYTDKETIFNDLEANYAPQLQAVLAQFNNAMANLTQDSEVITARTSLATGIDYDSLALILQAIESRQVVADLDTNKKYVTTLEVSEGQPRLRIKEVI